MITNFPAVWCGLPSLPIFSFYTFPIPEPLTNALLPPFSLFYATKRSPIHKQGLLKYLALLLLRCVHTSYGFRKILVSAKYHSLHNWHQTIIPFRTFMHSFCYIEYHPCLGRNKAEKSVFCVSDSHLIYFLLEACEYFRKPQEIIAAATSRMLSSLSV